MHRRPGTPRWIIAIIIAMTAAEPMLHLWIPHAAPDGARWSGLHTVDTYAYLTAMKHGASTYSPYARCTSSHGDTDPSLYSLPHHQMYAFIGTVGRWVHAPPFLWLGLINGLGVGLLLWAAWWLLREAVPRHAALAFVLFALGGGVAGIAYLIAQALGLGDQPGFAERFARVALYELSEGPRYQPWLLIARLYYALPMALGFLALGALLQGLRRYSGLHLAAAGGAMLACAFLNFRLGPMIWTAGVLYLFCAVHLPRGQRLRAGALLTVGMLAGAWQAVAWLSANPELSAGAFRSLSGQMWLLSFLYASAGCWVLLPRGLWQGVRTLPRWPRAAGYAGLAFGVGYGLLYLAYQAYYGNTLRGGDTNAAIFASDPALALALFMGVLALGRSRDRVDPERLAHAWFALWFLAFFCMAIAAFGRGWFLQFMPQRFMVVLGLPMAVVVAAGLQPLATRRPMIAWGVGSAIVVGGIVSMGVTWLGAYGPWGYATIQQHYPLTRWAYVSKADAALLDRIDADRVLLAPALTHPILGDVAVQRGLRTVYGNGTLDHSREVMPDVRTEVHRFFQPEAMDDAARRALIDSWCVDVVLCPDGEPVPAETLAALRSAPWLDEVAQAGRGVLFRVTR